MEDELFGVGEDNIGEVEGWYEGHEDIVAWFEGSNNSSEMRIGKGAQVCSRF